MFEAGQRRLVGYILKDHRGFRISDANCSFTGVVDRCPCRDTARRLLLSLSRSLCVGRDTNKTQNRDQGDDSGRHLNSVTSFIGAVTIFLGDSTKIRAALPGVKPLRSSFFFAQFSPTPDARSQVRVL